MEAGEELREELLGGQADHEVSFALCTKRCTRDEGRGSESLWSINPHGATIRVTIPWGETGISVIGSSAKRVHNISIDSSIASPVVTSLIFAH